MTSSNQRQKCVNTRTKGSASLIFITFKKLQVLGRRQPGLRLILPHLAVFERAKRKFLPQLSFVVSYPQTKQCNEDARDSLQHLTNNSQNVIGVKCGHMQRIHKMVGNRC